VAGRHAVAIRAVSPTGKPDPTPARSSWVVGSKRRLATTKGATAASGTAPNGGTGPPTGGAASTSTSPTPPVSPAHDDFDRPNSGELGAGWAAMSDGGLAISGGVAVGTSAGYSGDVETAQDYGSDQYSQVVLSANQLTGGEWIGPTVRSRNGGQDGYLGIYFWQNGSPNLELYMRRAGAWTQLGNSYPVTPLPAGTALTLVAVGTKISFLENGVVRIAVTDDALTGGEPGLMTYGFASARSWSGGDATATNPATQYSVGGTVSGLSSGSLVLQDNAGERLTVNSDGPFAFQTPLPDGASYRVTISSSPTGQTCTAAGADGTIASASVTDIVVTCTSSPGGMQVQSESTSPNGIAYYTFASPDDGGGTHILRVLTPTDPTPGVPHNFLYVLPVEPEQGTQYGDGLETLLNLNAQNQYNLTIIEPSFAIDPWYANNPDDPSVQYETFMTRDLVPWVEQNLGAGTPAGGGQNWLIGFSKSGLGAQDLLFKYPELFSLAASWDFPADMATYDAFGSSSADVYGTDANFQASYRLTASFLEAHRTPFLSSNRIWIGGYDVFGTDMTDYDALLSSEGIPHSTQTPVQMDHGWDSGWMQTALSALSRDSAVLAAGA